MIKATINGTEYQLENSANLLSFLRDELHITSPKNGCGEGACGACSVLIDGKAVRACLITAAQVNGKSIITVEGLPKQEREIYAYAFSHTGAVQCGFCTPGMVIAAKALLDKNSTPSPDEIKTALRGNVCRCTGYVKIEQAVKLAADLLRGEGKIGQDIKQAVGNSAIRIDARKKTLGIAQYVDDLWAGDMLYGAVLRAPLPRVLIKNIDTAAARLIPGVAAIMTAEDIPGKRHWGFIVKDWPVLVAVGEETRYIGDALALVAASSREIARQAINSIKVDYEELNPITSPAVALAADAPKLHQDGNLLSKTYIRRGNPEAALASSVHVTTAHYSTPFTEHAFLEPESALAIPGQEGSITIHAASQSVYEDQHGIMAILGLPADQVRVIGRNVGGAFGGKEDLSVQHHAALLAAKTGRPVKLTLSRQESIRVHPKRHAMELEVTTGCDENGKLTALIAKITADTGAYASLGPPVVQRACTHIAGPYVVPNVDITGLCVYTNNPPAGAFRGFGVPQAAFACESNLDQLARKAGLSPWEIRYRNALEPGQINATGQIADEGTAIKETLLAIRDIYHAHQYTGIACALKNTGIGVGLDDTSRVKLRVVEDRIQILTSAACLGQGLATVIIQIVCETTGIPFENIDISRPDTWLTPDAGTTTASRQTLFTGEAARQAALALKAALNKAGNLKALNGNTYYGEYAGQTDTIDSAKPNPISHVAYSYATHVVILNDSGRLQKVVAAHDVGRAINPKAIEGQIEGAIAMGLGYALREDLQIANGIPKAKFGTLGLLRSTDMPAIQTIVIEKNPSPLAYGAKGIGEIAAIPIAPAVASAYYRYDNTPRHTLPLAQTPYHK